MPVQILTVMFPTNRNPVVDLVSTGIGSLLIAVAAGLLERPVFTSVFVFFGSFAIAMAMRRT
jgi:hypothetical protein